MTRETPGRTCHDTEGDSGIPEQEDTDTWASCIRQWQYANSLMNNKVFPPGYDQGAGLIDESLEPGGGG